MTSQQQPLTVHVKYGDVEYTFSGSLEEVWHALNRFFAEHAPTFQIARTLVLNVDLQRLVEDCRGLIGFADNAPHLLVPKEKLTDNETLALHLLAVHLGFRLGILKTDVLSREELQAKLGKNPKITSTRLGELVKAGIAEKTSEGGYRMTSFGLVQMQREWLPKIKAKLGL
ncbi:MAG: hypothetical protein NZ932_01095 [Candidatus Bathyarchaeota archaeon]|nr:hypothetical protein [Candidatus Bathyarchaeota archaeon]MDW8040988.1 hypothetical protein [Nitrososphaerota archaeon]